MPDTNYYMDELFYFSQKVLWLHSWCKNWDTELLWKWPKFRKLVFGTTRIPASLFSTPYFDTQLLSQSTHNQNKCLNGWDAWLEGHIIFQFSPEDDPGALLKGEWEELQSKEHVMDQGLHWRIFKWYLVQKILAVHLQCHYLRLCYRET